MEKFGPYLKFLRETRSRMSQTQMASMIGVSQRYISQIEICASQPPTIDLCYKICECLKLNKEEEKKLLSYAATDRFSNNKSNKPFINFLPQFEETPLIPNPNDSNLEQTTYRNRFLIQWELENETTLHPELQNTLKNILIGEMSTKEYTILEIKFSENELKLILSISSPDSSIRSIANKIKAKLGNIKWHPYTRIMTLDPITVTLSSS